MEYKPIAYKTTSNFGGIEILDIKYETSDYVILRENHGEPTEPIKRKIHYETKRPYFNYKGRREHLDEYMRTNI